MSSTNCFDLCTVGLSNIANGCIDAVDVSEHEKRLELNPSAIAVRLCMIRLCLRAGKMFGSKSPRKGDDLAIRNGCK